MKALALSEGVLTAVALSLTITLIARTWAWFTSAQLAPDTLLLCVAGALAASVVVIFIRRMDRSMKVRLDLLFRMGYQAPFVQAIPEDAEERTLYGASILRKLRDLAELNRAYPDERLCSYYIGCLAFLANEKRANLPWSAFRDELAEHFTAEILNGKIARHVIDDHYQGGWPDLVEAAERATEQQKTARRTLRLGRVAAAKSGPRR